MTKKEDCKWLNSAVFYQIYPQSFNDTNGDGIGDIPGIIEKLDYIQSLGCDAIWVNPCFVSPFNDAGYDVADYYKVAPRYGTNADLKRLFKAAHKKGMRVCLDLVPGHTSIDHPHFQKSCQPGKNEFTNRYVWVDNPWGWDDPDSAGGVKTVHGYGNRHGAYVTNFFWSQPAINYGFAKPDPNMPWQLPATHPDCRATAEEMKNIMRFWLDMGADGFRVDMAFSLIKNDPGKRATIALWKSVRKMMDKEYPGAALIAEWFKPSEAIPAGFHVDFFRMGHDDNMLRGEKEVRLDLPGDAPCYFRKKGQGDISGAMAELTGYLRKMKPGGYVGFFTGNHDVSRISVGRSQKEVELVFAFILTMPWVPFVYYGDEIAMRYQDIPSKEGGYGRTGSRTPMQWSDGKNAGFSSARADKLYLPVDAKYKKLNVEHQEKNPRSLLNRVRQLTALRKEFPALQADGKFDILYSKPNKYPLIYMRSSGKQKILVAINPSGKSTKTIVQIPGVESIENLINAGSVELKHNNGNFSIEMDRVSYGVFELKG